MILHNTSPINMDQIPLVSVILPSRNGDSSIKKAIESVLRQTHHSWELLVIDDGSTDKTAAIAKEYAAKDSRIKYYHQDHSNQAIAKNNGMRYARADLIALIDDDDIWTDPKKLEEQILFMYNNPSCVAAGCHVTKVTDEEGTLLYYYKNPKHDEVIRRSMLLKNCFTNSSVIFRKKACEEAGGFRNIALGEDYDLWLRLGQKGTLANLDTFTIDYTFKRTTDFSAKRALMYLHILLAIKENRKYYPRYFTALLKGYVRLIDCFFLRNTLFVISQKIKSRRSRSHVDFMAKEA